MGRMFEAIRQAEAKRGRQTTLAAPRACRPEMEVVHADEMDEEIPFIEVGGGPATMHASPAVLASGSAPANKSVPLKHLEKGPHFHKPAKATPASLESGLMTVVFRPLPAEPVPLPSPQERFVPELVAFHRPEHPISDQYRTLLGALAEQLPEARPQVLMFTAATPEAGTTTVLLNGAITFARQGRLRVAVVDANLARPGVASRLGLPEVPGLSEVLAGTALLQEVLQETGQTNLLALTAGDADAGARLDADAMRSILGKLREHFDLVFVDAACWDNTPDVVALGSACDAVYLVLPQAESETPKILYLLKVIPEQGSQLRGCVLTRR